MKWNLSLGDKRVLGIEILINPDGNSTYNYSIIKEAGSKIDIEKSESGLTDLAEIIKDATNKIPIVVSINGKGVIHKEVLGAANETDEALFDKALPNSVANDFYIQVFRLSGTTAIVSFTRKNSIDAPLKSFESAGAIVIGCILGPFALQATVPLLSTVDEQMWELKFSSHNFVINNGIISSYSSLRVEEPAHVISRSNFEINSLNLLSFSAALSHFIPIDSITSNIGKVNAAKSDFAGAERFKRTGILLLAGAFVILLGNFMIYSYLFDKVQVKSSQTLSSSAEAGMLDSLRIQVEEKNRFLSKNGFFETSKSSYYADEIAKDIPPEISLTALTIQPLRKGDDEKEINFDGKKIVVSGRCAYSLNVNEWIKLMRKKTWVSSVVLLDYAQKGEQKIGDFSVVINLK